MTQSGKLPLKAAGLTPNGANLESEKTSHSRPVTSATSGIP